MTVSKVHIIYGEVTVGKRPAIRLHCFWWPESHERSLEFFGQSFSRLSPSLPDNPFLTVSSPRAHAHTDTCARARTVPRERTCMLRHPAQWLGALAKVPKSVS